MTFAVLLLVFRYIVVEFFSNQIWVFPLENQIDGVWSHTLPAFLDCRREFHKFRERTGLGKKIINTCLKINLIWGDFLNFSL